jgi:hypothetical protein
MRLKAPSEMTTPATLSPRWLNFDQSVGQKNLCESDHINGLHQSKYRIWSMTENAVRIDTI